jgi:CBS domain-containing protein/uncharacterized protein (DUF2267 family)
MPLESIQSFIHGHVLVLDEGTTVLEAARAMYERRVGSVVVHDRLGRIVGIITDRDLACQVLAFGLNPRTPIREIMTIDVVTLKKNQKLSDAINIMKENGVRRIPVVEKIRGRKTKCVGMVTLDDLLVAQAIDLATVSKIVRAQVVKRYRRPEKNRVRSNARSENRLSFLYKHLVDAMRLDKNIGEQVATHLLHLLVRSLPYTQAVHFIAQLPKLIQEELLDLPAGPDRTITGQSMIRDLKKVFGFNEKQIEFVLHGFWNALREVMKDSSELDKVLSRLPKEISGLFAQKNSGKNKVLMLKMSKDNRPAFEYL